MKKIIFSFVLAISFTAFADTATPKFSDYKVDVYKGKKAENIRKQDLDDDFFIGRKESLKETLNQGVNFSGRYAIAFYGCGGECLAGEVIDVKTGKVYYDKWILGIINIHSAHLKNYPVRDFKKNAEWGNKEIHFKKDSSLLVIKGAWGEEENAKVGTFYLNFKNGKFHLRRIQV